jgi:hypothetical protein
MAELTYVSLVPKSSSAKLRQVLSEEDTGPLVWREVRGGWGSEFHFTGPSDLVRTTHEFVTLWVANEKLARTVGRTADAPANAPWRAGLIRKAAAAAAFIVFAVVTFHGAGAVG